MSDHAAAIEWAAAAATQVGQSESGDSYFVQPLEQGLLLAVIDGLGHGAKAALAARKAVETLARHPHGDLEALALRCHHALIGTRGAVMSLALMQPAAGRLAWLSIGNVSGLLLRADRSATPTREHLLLRGGVVGYRIPPLRTFSERLDPGDTLLLVSDGIRSGFVEELPLALPPQQLADHILAHHNRQTDDATVLVARRQR